jgi:thiol-disulfide isomerase/thioredoxin
MNKKTILQTIILCGLMCLTGAAINLLDEKYKLRAYISTKLAKVVIKEEVIIPEEDVSEQCNGSGWITHGDGHRTPCTGCKACEKKTAKEVVELNNNDGYNLYHFGAEWCAPCERMKKETWTDTNLKSFMKKNNVKLFILDEKNPAHQEHFRYYKIEKYPTVVFLNSNDLDRPISRSSGFLDAEKMTAFLMDNLK